MFRQNLHAHSTYDDGKSTLREMIETSMAAGLTSVGISVHSPLPYDNEWGIPEERLPAYLSELRALQTEYAGRIEVFAGIEWDIMTVTDLSRFDYAIGSVHHLPLDTPPLCVDTSAEVTLDLLTRHFGGDADAMAEAYFAQYDAVAAQPYAKIVGHVDLLTKYDEQRAPIFDPLSPRYQKAAFAAMEKLVAAGKIFEINTGAISRGCRVTPYPSRELLCALREMGGKITVSADAHHVSGVTCAYDKAEALAKTCGFTQAYALQRTRHGFEFVAQPFKE